MSKFCPNCGKEIAEGADVCLGCGKALNNSSTSGKTKIAAGLLGIFLGAWGIHNFYLGFTGKGVAQIIVTIITCGVGGIWGFIEGILILAGSMNVDANGNRLVD